VGDAANPGVLSRYPAVPQRTWEEVLRFIFERFQTYHNRKADHNSWDKVGKGLWDLWRGTTQEQFVQESRKAFEALAKAELDSLIEFLKTLNA
jgi:hypothetical protein